MSAATTGEPVVRIVSVVTIVVPPLVQVGPCPTCPDDDAAEQVAPVGAVTDFVTASSTSSNAVTDNVHREGVTS